MKHHKSSRFNQENNLAPSQRINYTSQPHPMNIPTHKQPLKISNGVQQSQEKFYSPVCGKENFSSPLVLTKGVKSDKVKLALRLDNSAFEDKLMKGKQRSEKNYRDLNKSLANLVRVPGSSSSGEDMLLNKDFSVTTNLGPKLERYKTHTLSNTMNRGSGSGIVKKAQARTPQVSSMNEYKVMYTEANDYFAQDSYPLKKEKFQQTRSGVSNPVMPKNLKQGGLGLGYTHSKGLYTPHHRQLLTEGDVPNQREDYFVMSGLSPNLMTKVEEKRLNTNQDHVEKMGPKLFGSGTKQIETRNKKQTQKNQEILDLNVISDGVMYGEGGVPIYPGGKRVKQQEGECMIELLSHEKRNKEELAKAQCETVNRWKCELLEIQRDIAKRKLSYEKVNKFFTICDENGSFVNALNENAGETSTNFPVKRNLNFASHQTQSRPQTIQTLQTLPDQTPTRIEQKYSPTFTSRRQLAYGNLHTEQPSLVNTKEKKFLSNLQNTPAPQDQRAHTEVPVANEAQGRIKTLSHYEYQTYETQEIFSSFVGDNLTGQKPSCCSTKSGCQIF